jgi:hypothetical protein
MDTDDRTLVDNVILGINGGIFDHYLKAIVDASIMRRDALGRGGEIPKQFRISLTPKPPEVGLLADIDESYEISEDELRALSAIKIKKIARENGVVLNKDMTKDDMVDAILDAYENGAPAKLIDDVIEAARAKPIAQPVVAHQTAFAAPDDNTPAWTGKAKPLTKAEIARTDDDHVFVYGDWTYKKRDFYQKVLQIGPSLFGVSDQRVIVIGVKHKVKVLYVNEPPLGTLHGEDPHALWANDEPMFLDKDILEPWLDVPPVGQENNYLA